jgi:hypothetical protein
MLNFWLQNHHHLTAQSLGHDCLGTVDESLKTGKYLMYEPSIIFLHYTMVKRFQAHNHSDTNHSPVTGTSSKSWT